MQAQGGHPQGVSATERIKKALNRSEKNHQWLPVLLQPKSNVPEGLHSVADWPRARVAPEGSQGLSLQPEMALVIRQGHLPLFLLLPPCKGAPSLPGCMPGPGVRAAQHACKCNQQLSPGMRMCHATSCASHKPALHIWANSMLSCLLIMAFRKGV